MSPLGSLHDPFPPAANGGVTLRETVFRLGAEVLAGQLTQSRAASLHNARLRAFEERDNIAIERQTARPDFLRGGGFYGRLLIAKKVLELQRRLLGHVLGQFQR